ncbi:PREDICTED: uncharacterized protein LOC108377392 [Rhagoletis zephyria]|uniref:uncharacterized protein LOC108377392 n=1 Tax=Rhagoletis zephyria TaxID=28612 RepID=UPI0008116AD2|nr:PREDICTED: uncharacterized protein LOC108377392 [Rhagoletis zephyria]
MAQQLHCELGRQQAKTPNGMLQRWGGNGAGMENYEKLLQQHQQLHSGDVIAAGTRAPTLKPPTVQGSSRSNSNNWENNMRRNNEQRKTIPKLVYLHNPWKYVLTRLNLWKLRIFWDHKFKEQEFIRGSRQAVIVMTDIIRNQSTGKLGQFTTPVGFQQISRDMLLSRNDSRLRLVKFDTEHIRKAIPMKVATRKNFGRRYCFIDMLFVGLRNTKDFDSPEELVEINEILRKLDTDMRTPMDVMAVPHRIVFAEIFMRFRRDYTPNADNASNNVKDREWSVSFYKILTFDVLNYDPKP